MGLAAGPLYGYHLKTRKGVRNIILVIVLLLLTLGQSAYIFFSTGTFFVAGLSCIPLPVAPIAMILLLIWRLKNKDLLQQEKKIHILYWVGFFLIPAILISPFFNLLLLRSACFSLNQRAAQPIITTMENYYKDFGVYPEELAELQPDYLAEIPAGKCTPFRGAQFEIPKFKITNCSFENVNILTIPIASGEWIQRYNPETGNWATLSFLDGECSYLDR
jgi:NADH:ubiquinone oxidoreductase subunit 6 (subunit J)